MGLMSVLSRSARTLFSFYFQDKLDNLTSTKSLGSGYVLISLPSSIDSIVSPYMNIIKISLILYNLYVGSF